jgi:Leucine-rich repeat (LRR) protein
MTRIKGISKLKNLQSLLLMNNNLKEIPNISKLKNLRHLDLFNNKLKGKISFTNNNCNIEALNLG